MKRSQIRCWKSYCSEPLDKIEHYEEALAEGFAGWCMHHRLEIQPDGKRVSMQELKDKGLYYCRPAEELIFMRFGEHSTLHHKGENNPFFGKHLSEETRKKISESNKGENNPFFGKHHSEETLKRISEAHKGKHHKAESRRKMSEAHKGKHLSEEHRRKMSAALKGKHNSAEARKKMSEAHKGKLWWNDGISNKRSKECPGPEWKRGCLKNTGQA